MVVEARLNDISSAQVTVIIRVRPQKRNTFRFTKKRYTVIVPSSILKRQKILQLAVHKPDRAVNETVKYKLRTDTSYFSLNSKQGSLSVAKSLKAKGNNTMTLRVKAVIRGRLNFNAEATISVSIVPDFIGNQFVDSSLKVINKNSSIKPRNSNPSGRSRGRKGATEFRLHRMLRTPSPEARKISAADLKFNNVIRNIKRQVAERVLGKRIHVVDYFLLYRKLNSVFLCPCQKKKIKTG